MLMVMDSYRFCHVEAWTPSWGQCEREDLAPDFYLGLVNERMLDRPEKSLRFSQRLICALAQDQGHERTAMLQSALIRWARALQSPLLGRQLRPWGFEHGAGFSRAK